MIDLPSKAAIVVQRNNYALTKRTIASIWNQDIKLTLLVIDNASEDSIYRWIARAHNEEFHPYTATATLKEQESLGQCWNRGLRAAWRLGCTEAMVCNNDVELHPVTYRRLSETGRPFITPVNVGADKSIHQLVIPAPDSYEFDVHPDFSAFLIHKEVTDKVGFFNESYWPAYCEDCDYHVRMQRAGVIANSVNIPYIHHPSSTLHYATRAEKQAIERGAEANRQRFKEQWGCEPGTPEYAQLFAS